VRVRMCVAFSGPLKYEKALTSKQIVQYPDISTNFAVFIPV
jgi:hypothetical protein